MPLTIDATGIQIPTLAEVREEMLAALRAAFGDDFITDDDEIIPRIVTIVAEAAARNMSLLKSVTTVLTPGSARGVFADSIARITGVTRRGDTYSTVALALTGTASAVVPSTVARHIPTQTLWDLDGFTFDGAGEYELTATAQEPGPINIVASDSWELAVSVVDIDTVESTASSEPGQLEETDEQLEARRLAEGAASLAATARGIKAGVLAYLTEAGYGGVIDSVTAFVNPTAFYDEFGRPGGSVEILVDDNGAIPDEIIAAAIWNSIVAGIQPWGLITVEHVDEASVTQEVGFSRSTGVDVYIRVTIDTTSAEVTLGDESELEAALEAAIAEYGEANHPAGRNVVPVSFIPTVLAELESGSFSAVTIERSLDGSSWSASQLAIAPREEARFDDSRVTVVFTP